MSEAYLIEVLHVPLEQPRDDSRVVELSPLFSPLLIRKGMPAQRLQEIHILSGSRTTWEIEPELQESQPACFYWPENRLLPHFILHDCSRAIEAGEREFVLLVQGSTSRLTALVLASPKAVGKYNLLPRARLGCRGVVPVGKNALQAALDLIEAVGESPHEIARFACPDLVEVENIGAVFPNAQLLTGTSQKEYAEYILLSNLVDQLERNRLRLGLLYSKAAGNPGLMTLVERL